MVSEQKPATKESIFGKDPNFGPNKGQKRQFQTLEYTVLLLPQACHKTMANTLYCFCCIPLFFLTQKDFTKLGFGGPSLRIKELGVLVVLISNLVLSDAGSDWSVLFFLCLPRTLAFLNFLGLG